uniref:Uncharacterized protein n=1 Tax=Hordeum vulgare subsp. vulgare TaxID=112509 RepID=A0A8I6X6S3_HORVV
MAPPPLATAAAAEDTTELLEVRCAGCSETLEVERGLTEFVCPDCATPQSLPPELMPPPRRRALPLPRGAADARGARLPCGACGELLSVPVGLSRCTCPFCGAELVVDSARLRNYILTSAAAAVVPRSSASVPPVVAARERWQERPSYAMRAGLPQAEPDVRLIPPRRTQVERPGRLIHVHRDEQEYRDHVIDGEEIPVANETFANSSLQRNRPSLGPLLGRRIVGDEETHVFPQNEVKNHVSDQYSGYSVQPKRAKLARLHRVIHSEEMQDGPLNHEVYREARHTELIYEATATHRVGCSTGPQTPSIGERHMGTPTQIIQQVRKQNYHESHVEGSQIDCLDLDGVVHPPVNQVNHGEEASTEMIDKMLSRESTWPTGCSVGPNSVNVEKRKASTTNQVNQHMQKQQSDATRSEHTQKEHPDQAIHEPTTHLTNRETMYSFPIKETIARYSKQKKSKLVNPKTIAEKRHMESLNHNIQQADGQTSDTDSHEIQVDIERQSKANGMHDNTSTLKGREQVTPPNKLADLKQKNICTNDEIQKEQTEGNVSKQTSSWTQKKNRKGSIASSNEGLQLKRSKRLAKDSSSAMENKPLESESGDLQNFGHNVQVPADATDEESIEWVPLQQCPPSPDCEGSVASTDTDSVESGNDEDYVVSPNQSMSESDHPDIDRIVADHCPSTPSVHKAPQEISDELDDPDVTTTPLVPDMSDPEHFARNYLPLEVRRALAKGKKAGGRLCVKVWTLPKGVRIPVSLNTSGLPIGENAIMLINFLGALARDGVLAPLTYVSWTYIPKENKDVMWHIVKLKFDVDPSHELSLLRSIRNKWRIWKCHLKRKHYDPHITEEERLADRVPRVLKEQWQVLVAYWNTEKAKARSTVGKACRAKSTFISKTGSKSFARIFHEESRSGDPALENSEGSAMGAERMASTRRHRCTVGPSPKDMQDKSASQAARAKRKAGDEASTLRKEAAVTEESRPKNSQENAVLEAARAKRKAEDEAAALRKKVIVMEESQKKLQEDLARVTDAMSAMQKMMSTGGLPNGLMGEPAMPPSFQQEQNEGSSDDGLESYIVYSGLRHPSSHNRQTR